MKPVLAVAVCFLRDLARRPSSAALVFLVAGCALLLPRAADAGGPLRARLQVAAGYGLGLPVIIVSLTALALAAAAIAGDVESRRIQTVATKPCSGWQLLLGKLLGICAASAVLLLVVWGCFAWNIHSLAARAGASSEDRSVALHRFFTPRVAVHPEVPPVSEQDVRKYVESLSALPHASRRGDLEALARKALRKLRVSPGGSTSLLFRGVHAGRGGAANGEEEQVLLSFKLYWSPPGGSSTAECIWEIRDGTADDPAAGKAGREAGRAGRVPLLVSRQKVTMGTPREIALASSLLPSSGLLRVTVRNPAGEENRTLIVDPQDVEILVAYGRFWPSAARALALVLAHMTVLSMVALLAGAMFTAPTAHLLGFFIYLTGLASGFLRETSSLELTGPPRTALEKVGETLSVIGLRILDAFPDVGGLGPVDRLTSGRAILVGDLAVDLAKSLLVETGILLALAAWIFSRRELGRGGGG